MNYSEKLKSPKWQKKRLEVLNRDNFTCRKCGDTETELHVHHLKYTGEPHQAPIEDLETLCKHCHNYISNYDKIVSEHCGQKEILSVNKIDNTFIVEYHTALVTYGIYENGEFFAQPFAIKKNSLALSKLYELSTKYP